MWRSRAKDAADASPLLSGYQTLGIVRRLFTVSMADDANMTTVQRHMVPVDSDIIRCVPPEYSLFFAPRAIEARVQHLCELRS